MKNFFYLKGIKAALSLSLILLASGAYAQNQITMTMSDPTNVTATSFEFDINVAETGATALKLSAAAAQVFQSPVSIPVAPTIPTYAVLNEGPVYAGLLDPVPTYSSSTFRIQQTPIGSAASAVLMPTSATQLLHVKITSNSGNIVYPVTLKFRTSTPNISLSAYVDAATTVTSFSLALGNLILGPDLVVSGPADLELLEFSGEMLKTANKIKWLSATERDVASHIVERSADASKWSEVGRVAGQLNSNTTKEYDMEDKAPLAKAYYRLRSVDVDGTESFSKTILLERKSGTGINGVFPSPTSGPTTVRYTAEGENSVTLRIADLTGRIVLESTLNAFKGVNDFPVDMTRLPAGSYVLKIENGAEVSAPVQVVKQ